MSGIGILGGMGSYATLDIFRRLLNAFPAEKEWDRPRIVIDNNCAMPSRVRAILYGEREKELIDMMSAAMMNLSSAGCDRIIIGCITAHSFLHRLRYTGNVINMVELTARAVAASGIKELFAVCSEGTRDVDIWGSALKPYGISVRYPDEKQMLRVRSYIELVKQNRINAADYEDFKHFVDSQPEENVILGCTELPILARRLLSNPHIFDPIQITINHLIEGDHN